MVQQLFMQFPSLQKEGKGYIGVQCSYCGQVINHKVYDKNRSDSSRYYCCVEHRQLGVAQQLKGSYNKDDYDINLSIYSTKPPNGCIKEFKIDSCLNCPLPDCRS
jgi:hypothetical protein